MTLKQKTTLLCKQAKIREGDLAKAFGINPSGLSVMSGKRPVNHILVGNLTKAQAETGKTGRDFLDLVESLK